MGQTTLKTATALLIPLSLSIFLVSTIALPVAGGDGGTHFNLDDPQSYHIHPQSSNVYVAGSTIHMNIHGTTMTERDIVYRMKDAHGDVVYKWKHKPDVQKEKYSSPIGDYVIYSQDSFEMKIPTMWGRPEGEWKIDAYFVNQVQNPVTLTFNVQQGSFWDNYIFAPTYIYEGQSILGFEVSNFHVELPPLFHMTAPIFALFGAIIYISYLRREVYPEAKELVSRSSTSIQKAWGKKT